MSWRDKELMKFMVELLVDIEMMRRFSSPSSLKKAGLSRQKLVSMKTYIHRRIAELRT